MCAGFSCVFSVRMVEYFRVKWKWVTFWAGRTKWKRNNEMKCISMRCSTGVPLCIQKGIKWFSQTFQNWDFPGVVRLKYKFSAENANCKWIPKSVQLMRIDQNTNCDKIKIECYIPGNVNQQDPWKVNENRFFFLLQIFSCRFGKCIFHQESHLLNQF